MDEIGALEVGVASPEATPYGRSNFGSGERGEGDSGSRVKGHHPWEQGESSPWLAASNLAAGVLGAGILGMPFAFDQAGVPMACMLLLLAAVFTHWGLCVVVSAGRALGCKDLEDLASRCYGGVGRILLCAALALNGVGSIVSYLVIARDTVPVVMARLFGSGSLLASKYFTTSLLGTCIALPLSMLADIRHLETFSVVSLISVLFVTCVVVGHLLYHGMPPLDDRDPTHHYVGVHKDVFPSFGTISFALVCHQLAFAVGRSVKNPTYSRWRFVSGFAISVSFFMLLLMGLCGFLGFLDPAGNILESLNDHSGIADVSRVLTGVHVLLAYPLEFYIVRGVVFKLLFPTYDTHPGAVQHPFRPAPSRCAKWTVHVLLTFFMWAVTMGIALSGAQVCFVFELTGSSSAVCLAFVFPAASFLRVTSPSFEQQSETRRSLLTSKSPRSAAVDELDALNTPTNRGIAWVVLVTGLLAFVSSTGTTLYNEIAHGHC